MDDVKIIECPRDAWQGLPKVIPTSAKVDYLRRLIEAGFRHIDAVSFVSPKYVPQMADSEEVMKSLTAEVAAGSSRPTSLPESRPVPSPETQIPALEFIGIVVNERGLARALGTPGVTTIGYPYSISAYFRRANANMSRSESRALVEKLKQVTTNSGRNLVVYISMAFGNPYDEPWSPEIVEETLVWLKGIGVKTVSLADTVGLAGPKDVGDLMRAIKSSTAGIELGVHLHGRAEVAAEKVLAAYEGGCRRYDSALTGLGGCPFAGDELVGNIPTEVVVQTLSAHGVPTGIEPWALLAAVNATWEIRREFGV